MPPFKTAQLFVLLSWLAIFLVGVVSGDRVVDVAFEAPEFSDRSGAGPVSEEPDNSAEHVLMPSSTTDHRAGFTALQVVSHIDATIISPEPALSHLSGMSRPESRYSSRSRAPSFLLALRI